MIPSEATRAVGLLLPHLDLHIRGLDLVLRRVTALSHDSPSLVNSSTCEMRCDGIAGVFHLLLGSTISSSRLN